MAKQKHPGAKQQPKPVSKSSPQAKKPAAPAKKARGTVLTVILVLIMIHSIIGAYLTYTNLNDSFVTYRPWVLGGLVLVNLACLVAAIAMWYWKQWGIYLYLAAALVSIVIYTVMTGSVMLMAIYGLLPVAILAYVLNLQHKRQLFA